MKLNRITKQSILNVLLYRHLQISAATPPGYITDKYTHGLIKNYLNISYDISEKDKHDIYKNYVLITDTFVHTCQIKFVLKRILIAIIDKTEVKTHLSEIDQYLTYFNEEESK